MYFPLTSPFGGRVPYFQTDKQFSFHHWNDSTADFVLSKVDCMVLREWASDCFCPTLPFRTSNRSNQKCNSQSQESQEGCHFSSSWILWKRVKVTQLLPSVPCWNPNNTYSAIFPASVLGFPLKLANYSFRKVVWVHKKNKVWPTAIPGLLNMPSLANREPPKNGIVKPVASSVLGVPTSEVIHWYTQL